MRCSTGKMPYPVDAKGYLSRAKAALENGRPEGLFYAAYELRCCVEARQAEYVEALTAFNGTKVRPWELSLQGKRIRNKSYASTLTLMRYTFPNGTTHDSYHTPVTNALLSFANKTLHSLMHCQPEFRDDDNPWWDKMRAELVEGYRMAWLACQGDSMVPPLWNSQTKEMHPVRLSLTEENAHLVPLLSGLQGQTVGMSVSYPKKPPSKWVCDL